ncbi:arylesterase, partial [Acinetobacter baumannii]
ARLKERRIEVLMAGMLAPPNMGAAYAGAFNPIFPELASKHGLLLDPFFLDGGATVAGLSLADGMHPNARGVDVMVQ